MKSTRVAAAIASALTTLLILYALQSLFDTEPEQMSRAQPPAQVAAATTTVAR